GDALAGRGDVVVERVAVRELRHAAGVREGADADHVGQRRRVARVRPGRRVRLVGVADGGNEDGSALRGVGNRVRLLARVRVALGVRGIAEAAEAEVDHLRAL